MSRRRAAARAARLITPLLCVSASAWPAAAPTAADLARCAAMTAPDARLACYDSLSAPPANAAPGAGDTHRERPALPPPAPTAPALSGRRARRSPSASHSRTVAPQFQHQYPHRPPPATPLLQRRPLMTHRISVSPRLRCKHTPRHRPAGSAIHSGAHHKCIDGPPRKRLRVAR